MKKLNQLAALLLGSATLLAGCGGGGTSDTTPVATPDASSALQTTVPSPTYGAGAVSLSAFNALNSARLNYGVGLFAQKSQLDAAASSHSQYNLARYQAGDFQAVGHIEEVSKSGFTGVSWSNRIAAAQYSASLSGETISTFNIATGVQSDPGVVAVNAFLSAPYHRFALFDEFRDIGIADAAQAFANEGGTRHFLTFDFAVAQGAQAQMPATNWVGLWPLANATDVQYGFAGESPNPLPENNGACGGYPVSVQVRSDLTLTTTVFTLVETATNAAISARLSTLATDANPTYARKNSAYIIPFQPLKLNTQYTAHFVGAANGVAIDKTWTFTTTTQNSSAVYLCNPS